MYYKFILSNSITKIYTVEMNHPPMQLPAMTFASKVFHFVITSCHSFKKLLVDTFHSLVTKVVKCFCKWSIIMCTLFGIEIPNVTFKFIQDSLNSSIISKKFEFSTGSLQILSTCFSFSSVSIKSMTLVWEGTHYMGRIHKHKFTSS